jgi:hypothetical protein
MMIHMLMIFMMFELNRYEGYKNYFSFWAMGRFWKTYKYGGDLRVSDL